MPNGWYEVLRGQRPPSARWLTRGQHQHAPHKGNACPTTTESTGLHQCKSRQKPQPKQAARVGSLEAAISALGNADGPALKSLQEALSKAKQATQVPVGERLEACLHSSSVPGNRARLAAEPKGKFDWKHCAQKRDWRPPLNQQLRWMLGRNWVGAGCDRRPSEGTFPVEGFTPRWFDGCGGGHDDHNGCGDTRGQSLRAYGGSETSAFVWRVRRVLLGPWTFLRGLRTGEAAHPGLLIDEGTARMDSKSTVGASQGAITRNLVDFRGRADRVRDRNHQVRTTRSGRV